MAFVAIGNCMIAWTTITGSLWEVRRAPLEERCLASSVDAHKYGSLVWIPHSNSHRPTAGLPPSGAPENRGGGDVPRQVSPLGFTADGIELDVLRQIAELEVRPDNERRIRLKR